MRKPRLLVLSLGGTITMTPGTTTPGITTPGTMTPGTTTPGTTTPGPGLHPTLGADELVRAVPALGDIAEVVAESLARLASPSLDPGTLLAVARRVARDGHDAAVVIQGTDTIEESAFLLDLVVPEGRAVAVTGAMRGAAAPGADGPANLLAAARAALHPEARGMGTLVVMGDEIHAARFVRKAHTTLPAAFASPLAGPVGLVAEERARFHLRLARLPVLPIGEQPLPPVALVPVPMGEDARLLGALPDLGYRGAVVEGMGGGHVPAAAVENVAALARSIPVVLAARPWAGPVLTGTYGYPGAELDLLRRGLVPAGILPGPKARLLLALALRGGLAPATAFAPYQ